jgi:osmotically-inducible protein OsmY
MSSPTTFRNSSLVDRYATHAGTTDLTSSFFASIPPERIGLTGEYDHNGLAKRVELALTQQFKADDIQHLRVAQRGAVVVLTGKLEKRSLLDAVIQVAQAVYGATAVEALGVRIPDPDLSDRYGVPLMPFSSSSYAY